MIVNDAPPFRQLLKGDRRHSRRFLAFRHLQAPASPGQYRPGAKRLELELREIEGTHVLALPLIAGAIPIERRLPAARLGAVAEEDHVGRLPVALHEALEVAAVPRLHLRR